MVYNRCIWYPLLQQQPSLQGRRFNYYNNAAEPSKKTEQMGYNPNVTVRARGVMEKCTTVCSESTKRRSRRNERRDLRDGDIVPACAQTCPTSAITFGDLSDPDSRVTETQKSKRSYKMLAELNVRPRTSYLVQLKNPVDKQEG